MLILFLLILPCLATETTDFSNEPDTYNDWSLSSTPTVAPGLGLLGTKPSLDSIQNQLRGGDAYGALRTARQVVDTVRDREARHTAYLVMGLLYRRLGYHNMASEAFTKVRVSKRTLAHWGAFFEAEQDFLRGKPYVSLKECQALKTTYTQSTFRDACTRIELLSLAATGKEDLAIQHSMAYDTSHPYSLIADKIKFHGARWLLKNAPVKGLQALKSLAVRHKDPTLGRATEMLYHETTGTHLLDEGVLSLLERQRYALSLKESGRKDEAWTLFKRIENDDLSNAWIRQNEISFAWQAKEYGHLVGAYQTRYQNIPEPMTAWRAMSAAWRAGDWTNVRHWLSVGQKSHAEHRKWRRSNEQIGRVWMLGRDYSKAIPRFHALSQRSGSRGRRGRFLNGFAEYMKGNDDAAIQLFTELINAGRGDLDQYRYWRHKAALRTQKNAEQSQADAEWIVTERPKSWYAFLLRYEKSRQKQDADYRTGQWSIKDIVNPMPLPTETQIGTQFVVGAPIPETATPSVLSAFAGLAWPYATPSATPDRPSQNTHLLLFQDPKKPLQHYDGIIWYDADTASTLMRQVSDQHEAVFPRLKEATLLASVGLYDWSSITYGAFFNTYETALKDPEHPKHAAARGLNLESQEWKSTFYYTRDAYNGMRHNYGTWKHVVDAKNRRDLERLHWPLAYGATVWDSAKRYGVDPYLVLAIMRAESRYDAFAVSKAGAKGPMQIMPRTGRLLAYHRKDIHFDVTDLHYPQVAIDYGTEFLGLLLERFGGAFHLAIASYNGGPFAVSSWLKGTGHDMPIDEWVEHILYDETRRYVKRVSMYYEEYLRLYAPKDTHIAFPSGPYEDDRDIVDF